MLSISACLVRVAACWIERVHSQVSSRAPIQYKNAVLPVEKSHCGNKTVVRPSCLVHPAVRDKRRVSEIDLSQPRHETAFWWRHNGPVTSQLIDPIKWPNYPLQLIGICVHKTHTTKNPCRKDVVDRQMYNCVGYFCIYPYGLSLNGWHALLCIANYHHGVTITTHATRRHFLIWMTTVRQPTKRRRSCVLTLNTPLFVFIGERDKESTTPWLW